MDILFMGSPEFAVPALEQLAGSEHDIVGVVSGTDKRRGRRGTPVPTKVKAKALELGLLTIDTDTLQSEEIHNKISELNPDLIVVVAFKILPDSLLEIPAYGAINIHASLLPKFRGAAPIHWAVINGETETGITIFKLDTGIDTGKIIHQQSISIGPDETTGSVYQRLMKLGAQSLVPAINRIDDRSNLKKQDEAIASYAPKVYKEDAKIDFAQSAETIHNLVRGMNPFPTAWTTIDEQQLSIHQTELAGLDDLPNVSSGEITTKNQDAWVGTGTEPLKLKKVQLQGKQKVKGFDFVNGWKGSLRLG